VQLLNLQQAQWLHFDAVILAGAEREFLPGTAPSSPFFNDAVRSALHLPAQQYRASQRLYQFCLCLHHANAILITHRREQEGEPVARSPWVDLLTSFHRIGYQNALQDEQLGPLTLHPDAEVTRCDTPALPSVQTQPAPRPEPALLPGIISAGDYQQLLDCPYQFFAARCLQLSPPEEVRMALSKREYGQRVHQCLQAFHGNVANLPGPFDQPVTDANREQATAMLQRISEQVFAADLQDNFTHRGWYHRWRAIIPFYIQWQIDRQPQWQVAATEQKLETPLNDRLKVKGRLDRSDQGPEGMSIIDYKTGSVPKPSEVTAGEKIQLPFYALLSQQGGTPIKEVLYVTLDKAEKIHTEKTKLTGEQLQDVTARVAERLVQLMDQLRDGHAMPAWEDEDTCRFCDMNLLCRVQVWQQHG
jgi:ATP-dependent helicase/nuclease subunit B